MRKKDHDNRQHNDDVDDDDDGGDDNDNDDDDEHDDGMLSFLVFLVCGLVFLCVALPFLLPCRAFCPAVPCLVFAVVRQ